MHIKYYDIMILKFSQMNKGEFSPLCFIKNIFYKMASKPLQNCIAKNFGHQFFIVHFISIIFVLVVIIIT